MGKIEGIVAGMAQTVSHHVEEDANRFKTILDELQTIKGQRLIDTQATLQRERDLSKWKWSTTWAIVGTIFGGSIVAAITALLRHFLG